MTDDERFIEWWCSPNASSARLTPQDEPGACAGFAAGLAAGRAEVQKRIDESPVVTCHTDDLGSHVVFVGDAPGPWHLVPVEPKDD